MLLDKWEETELDRKWAELQASNWMYGQGFGKGSWTNGELKREHETVTSVILFSMQRLDRHAPGPEAEW